MGRLAALLGLLVLSWALPSAASCPVPDVSPVISVTDLDGDGRYSGEDIEAALLQCAAQGGCTVQLLPETYDDVAILISSGHAFQCVPGRTACLDTSFPNGLVIRGAGSSTVLRSPVWAPGVRPVAVLELIKRPEIPFRLESLVLDGRSPEQPGGDLDIATWWHYGFSSWSGTGDPKVHSTGCIRDVTVQRFLTRGISLASGTDWVVENNIVQDIGCWNGLTVACPLLAGFPDRGGVPGYKSGGVGILLAKDMLRPRVTGNLVRRVVKYAIGIKAGEDGLVPSILNPVVEDNWIGPTGAHGIWLAGVAWGRFARNVVWRTRRLDAPEQATFFNTSGITCQGRVQQTDFVENQFLRSAGVGLAYQCIGGRNRIVDTLFSGSCELKHPGVCVPGTGNCYRYADLHINLTHGPGHLTLENVSVEGSGCAKSLDAQGSASSPFTLEILGGSFPTGSEPSVIRDVVLGIEPAP